MLSVSDFRRSRVMDDVDERVVTTPAFVLTVPVVVIVESELIAPVCNDWATVTLSSVTVTTGVPVATVTKSIVPALFAPDPFASAPAWPALTIKSPPAKESVSPKPLCPKNFRVAPAVASLGLRESVNALSAPAIIKFERLESSEA
jgi:hypothetical protein